MFLFNCISFFSGASLGGRSVFRSIYSSTRVYEIETVTSDLIIRNTFSWKNKALITINEQTLER